MQWILKGNQSADRPLVLYCRPDGTGAGPLVFCSIQLAYYFARSMGELDRGYSPFPMTLEEICELQSVGGWDGLWMGFQDRKGFEIVGLCFPDLLAS